MIKIDQHRSPSKNFSEHLMRELTGLNKRGSTDENSPPQAGKACPHCRTGQLAYDGTLNLCCSKCGYVSGFVCT